MPQKKVPNELASGTYQDLTTPLGRLLNLPGFLPLAMTKAFRKGPHFNLCLGLLGPVPLASSCGTPRLILSPTMLQILPVGGELGPEEDYYIQGQDLQG